MKRLDAELMKYKEQMSKMRDGPGKVRRDWKLVCKVVECGEAKGDEDLAAEEDVRGTTGPVDAAVVQYGTSSVHNGELEEYNHHRRGDESRRQGDETAVQEDQYR
jgi:hypothetical protein